MRTARALGSGSGVHDTMPACTPPSLLWSRRKSRWFSVSTARSNCVAQASTTSSGVCRLAMPRSAIVTISYWSRRKPSTTRWSKFSLARSFGPFIDQLFNQLSGDDLRVPPCKLNRRLDVVAVKRGIRAEDIVPRCSIQVKEDDCPHRYPRVSNTSISSHHPR